MAAEGGVSYSSPVVASPCWIARSFAEGILLRVDLRVGSGGGAPLRLEGCWGGGSGRNAPGMAGEQLLARLSGGESENGGAVCAPVAGGW